MAGGGGGDDDDVEGEGESASVIETRRSMETMAPKRSWISMKSWRFESGFLWMTVKGLIYVTKTTTTMKIHCCCCCCSCCCCCCCGYYCCCCLLHSPH
jgi:hypothetical protein